MFDWNDEELTNIIWGEAGESEDQIVSYPNQVEEKPGILHGENIKKETNQQTSDTSTIEQKNLTTKPELELGLDCSSKYDTTEIAQGLGLSSLSGVELTLSNAAESHSISGNATLSNIAKSPISGSTLAGETSQLDNDSELLKKQTEDREQGDFVDYSWANIGSFDDLDRIFSNNDDPIFGDLNVGNADELWSSSKDVNGSSLEPATLSGDSSDFPERGLRISTEESEIKAQYVLDQNHPFISGYDTFNVSHAPRDAQASIDNIEPSGGKSNLLVKGKTFEAGGKIQASSNKDIAAARPNEFSGKTNRPKKFPKDQKSDRKAEVRQLNNPSSTWHAAQYPPSMVSLHPPLMLTQHHKHFSGVPMGTPLYGNMANPYSTPVMAQFHPMEGNHELLSPGYQISPRTANSVKKPVDSAVKPMTPEEKIEKLRRRQQMRAKLAIQKQQLQFSNQITVSEPSNMEGATAEVEDSLGSFHSLEPKSPLERDASNKISVSLDNCSVEESVLYRLQETIAKLDVRIRLCIRDSLFRLARSAMLRQFPNDTSSRDEALNKDKINHERFTRIPDIETDTNPIDRTVAHLLFHRPMEFSGKPVDTPESPLSANLSYDRISNSSRSLVKGYFPGSSENTPKGSKTPALSSKDEQSKISPRVITSENASNNESVDVGQTKDGPSL